MSESPWIYIVILGAAAILYGLMQPKIKRQQSYAEGTASNMEETLEQFMAEMERDNEEIIGLIADMKHETLSKQLSQQEQITELQQQLLQYEKQSLIAETRLEQLEKAPAEAGATVLQTAAAAEAVEVRLSETEEVLPGDAPAVVSKPVVPTVRERYPELFELYEQGKSMDTVAKTIGMARGEVQLILQLAKREESSL